MNLIDLTGMEFGRWRVVRYSGRGYWFCECKCGSSKNVRGSTLRDRESNSCGCLLEENARSYAVKHGLYGTPTYESWRSMIDRVLNPNCPAFDNYGGRGIKICRFLRKSV